MRPTPFEFSSILAFHDAFFNAAIRAKPGRMTTFRWPGGFLAILFVVLRWPKSLIRRFWLASSPYPRVKSGLIRTLAPRPFALKQLALDLALCPPVGFADFVAGGNGELLFQLGELARGRLPERSLYLWGEAGRGKSHLLAATAAAATSHGLSCRLLDARHEQLGEADHLLDLVLVDEVQALGAEQQVALFAVYNSLRDGGGSVLAAGDLPPAQLALREDLKNRLGWGLIYEVQALSDGEKTQALQQQALHRGFHLPDEVCHYLLTWHSRDLPSLLAVLTQLDRASLAAQRRVTLPLLKTVLNDMSQGKQ